MNATKQTTVLLADDHAAVRQGLRTVLVKDAQIRVVGEARNGREAVEMAHRFRPQVILMDISMPIVNGLDATRQILAERPSIKVIMLSAHVEDEYVERAKEVGAVGYIAKQMSAEKLAWAIEEVVNGHCLCDPVESSSSPFGESGAHDRKGAARSGAERLTSRESELLRLVAGGSHKRQIAAKLRISIGSVERLLGVVMGKLDIPNLANLAIYAVASGYIENDVDLVIT